MDGGKDVPSKGRSGMRTPSFVLVGLLVIFSGLLGEQFSSPRQTSAQTPYDQKVERTWVVRTQRPLLLSSVSLTAAPSSDIDRARVIILAGLTFSAGEEPKTVRVVVSSVRVVEAGSSWSVQDDVVPVLPGGIVKLSYDVPTEVTKATITISQHNP
jgi:hypothetical protein